MYENGKLITAGLRDRVPSGPLGVKKYIPEKCNNGYTLFSPAFGYTEYLMDMNGLIVHTWPVTHSQLGELLPNGNLLVDNYRFWLEELLPDGSRIWIWEGNEKLEWAYHHDFYIANEDEIFLLARKKEPVIEGFYQKGLKPECMNTDLVLKINRQKDILWEFSFSEHLDELCKLSGLPLPVSYVRCRKKGDQFRPYRQGDWAHTNTVEVLPSTPLGEKDSRFRAGNILVSFRSLDIIAIIDPEKNALVWCYGLGLLDGQHQPTMLDNGNILIFDNGTYRGYSVVREINPVTEKIVWEYMDGENFYSPYRAGVQRFSNGNTLICESDAGRIFEVTSNKEIVWDFYSPFVGQGKIHQGKHIYRATRYPYSYAEPLLRTRKDEVDSVADEQRHIIKTYSELMELYRT